MGPVPPALLPEVPGLYRLRENGSDELPYVGQTGRGLRSRLGALRRGACSAHMPFRDPHAAAPALWALPDSKPGAALEASVVPGPDHAPTRRGCEDLCLGRYRQTHKRSPAFNFARMPPGYAASSCRAGGRRGGRGVKAAHRASIPPPWPLALRDDDAWRRTGWRYCGLPEVPNKQGVYRLHEGGGGVMYVGRGRMRARVSAHLAEAAAPVSAYGRKLNQFPPTAVSIFPYSGDPSQLEKLQTDALAALIWTTGEHPPAQHLPQSG